MNDLQKEIAEELEPEEEYKPQTMQSLTREIGSNIQEMREIILSQFLGCLGNTLLWMLIGAALYQLLVRLR